MELLKSIPKTKGFVFPGRGGKQRTDIHKQVRAIADAAGLPKDFRPLHGLRHWFATTLANDDNVTLFHVQKLLTHKDLRSTSKYSHAKQKKLRKKREYHDNIYRLETNSFTKKGVRFLCYKD